MQVFLTGVNGFAGSHLADVLLSAGHSVHGLVHAETGHQGLPEHPDFHAVPGDLLDRRSLMADVTRIRPELIFHLAGQASPSKSWEDPALTLAVNSGGTANVLEAALASGRPRVVVVTSAEIYGSAPPETLPITEETQPSPNHPYGISKLAASQLALLYWQRYQLPVMEARPFNHVGPGQALGFVVPDFASQLAAIKLGRKDAVMGVGNLSAERDFTDVRDVVRAYLLLALSGRPGETYLICSGRTVSIENLLDILLKLSGLQVSLIEDPERLRASETPRLYGTYGKISCDTGWKPEIPLQRSLADALEEWMTKLA